MNFDKQISFIESNKRIGKRDCFGWNEIEMKVYLRWAACFGYLFEVWNDSELCGIGVAYPVKSKSPERDDFFKFSQIVDFNDEKDYPLFVSDWLSVSKQGRVGLVDKFKRRFPNWDTQTKLGIQNDKVRVLSNKYINLLNNI